MSSQPETMSALLNKIEEIVGPDCEDSQEAVLSIRELLNLHVSTGERKQKVNPREEGK